jgi:hypothetical protein
MSTSVRNRFAREDAENVAWMRSSCVRRLVDLPHYLGDFAGTLLGRRTRLHAIVLQHRADWFRTNHIRDQKCTFLESGRVDGALARERGMREPHAMTWAVGNRSEDLKKGNGGQHPCRTAKVRKEGEPKPALE